MVLRMAKKERKPSEGTRLLRVAFLASGKSIKDFASDNGVDRTYMSRLLDGSRAPGLQFGARWEHDLGIAIPTWGQPPTAPLPELVPHAKESGELPPAAETQPTGTHGAE